MVDICPVSELRDHLEDMNEDNHFLPFTENEIFCIDNFVSSFFPDYHEYDRKISNCHDRVTYVKDIDAWSPVDTDSWTEYSILEVIKIDDEYYSSNASNIDARSYKGYARQLALALKRYDNPHFIHLLDRGTSNSSYSEMITHWRTYEEAFLENIPGCAGHFLIILVYGDDR